MSRRNEMESEEIHHSSFEHLSDEFVRGRFRAETKISRMYHFSSFIGQILQSNIRIVSDLFIVLDSHFSCVSRTVKMAFYHVSLKKIDVKVIPCC